MISIKEIAKIKKPLVWTLHDCWPFLGAEHHFAERNGAGGVAYWSRGVSEGRKPEDGGQRTEVGGQRSACGEHRRAEVRGQREEPKVSSLQPKVSSAVNRYILKKKQKAWRNLKVSFVAPSNWMAGQVRQSKLFINASISVIPNGLDANVFRPLDKMECRQQMNLPQEKILILFGAYNPLDPNKGSDLLEKALLALPKSVRNGLELVVFGANGSRNIAGLKTHWAGVVSSEGEMATLYNCTNVVCVPSRKESYGLVAAEGIACGVPVIGFRTSGLIDIIAHKENGWLANPFDVEDFAKGIRWAMESFKSSPQALRDASVVEQHVAVYERVTSE